MNSFILKSHYSGKELVEMSLSCLPSTVQGIIYKSKKEGWTQRARAGRGGGVEFAFNSLPENVQQEIKNKLAPRCVSTSTELDIVRQCPALLESKTADLTDKQREIADARAAVVVAVLALEESGLTRKKSVDEVSIQSQNDLLPPELQQKISIANAKKGNRIGVGSRMLMQWVLDYTRAKDSAERLYLLAPGQKKAIAPEQITWLPDFLAIYRDPRGFNLKQSYRFFCEEWARRYAGQQNAIDACPSYDAVRRAMKKLPIIVKEKFRVTGSAWRSLNPYVQRDWSQMPVNGVWVGDGHNLKMDVQHPLHGRPFSPEITLVIDSRTRFIVGWSLSLSENALAVADALRHAMENHGRPLIYYSDNGGGETNKMLDADITGILPRLGVEHRTGIPGNPQGRGIIERLNKEVPNMVARQFDTYHGTGADNETVRITKRAAQSAINALSQGKELTTKQQNALSKLPTWQQLIDVITDEVERYNTQHEHRALPKRGGRHMTPAAYRRYLVEEENHEIDYLSAVELRDMFRPQLTRIVERGQVQLFNNKYFAVELAEYHKDEVIVTYDIHNPNAVVVRDMAGKYICNAIWNGNMRDAFPKPVIETLQEKRVKGMVKRAQNKIDEAKAELNPLIESNSNNFDFDAILHQAVEPEKEAVPIFLTEADKNQWLAEQKKKAINE